MNRLMFEESGLLANQAMARATMSDLSTLPINSSLSHRVSGGMDILASHMSSLTISISLGNVSRITLRFGQTDSVAPAKSKEEQSVFITELFGSRANTISMTSGEMKNMQKYWQPSEDDLESLESLTGWSPVISRTNSPATEKIINELSFD